jgi:hypothetical protein
MESVKVDMQKLQLLNDRIAQTIDALNQLRLSVHGIQHSPWPGIGYGYGSYAPYNVYGAFGQPTFGQSFGQPQFAQPGFVPQYNVPFVPGLSHTTQVAPWQTAPWAASNGISHTAFDPTWQQRTTQGWPYPVSIY